MTRIRILTKGRLHKKGRSASSDSSSRHLDEIYPSVKFHGSMTVTCANIFYFLLDH